MIIYDLVCDIQHRFEGWFKNAEEFAEQQRSGMLICPMCGSDDIRKIPSGSHITKNRSKLVSKEQGIDKQGTHQLPALQLVHDYINKNFEDVGNNFAAEAKKIHFGETEERNIRGTATRDEIKELKEEGVAAIQLPPAPYDKDKLN